MNWKSNFKSLGELHEAALEQKSPLESSDDLSVLLEPVQMGRATIPNSLAVHPMEGCDGERDGSLGELTSRRYDRFASGGCGLLWVEATAVVHEGRANPRQLWLHEGNLESYKKLVARMRQKAWEGMGRDFNPYIVLQLTHSGRYSKPDHEIKPVIMRRDPYRDPMQPEAVPSTNRPSRIVTDGHIISDDALDKLQESSVHVAMLAQEAGFDAVDIKACHGYLISEMLSSHERKGRYGGAFEHRTRFLLEVIDGINAKKAKHFGITTRLGFYDAIPWPHGWGVDRHDYQKPDLNEPIQLARHLAARGVGMINFTMASPYYNPHIGRPFAKPIRGAYDEPEHPVKGVHRMINVCAEVQKALPDMAMVGTGYSWLREYMPQVMAGVKKAGKAKLFGSGRMAFAYPDFARDIMEHGQLSKTKVCIACSGCTQIMRDGNTTGCTVRDKEIYATILQYGLAMEKQNACR